MKTIYGFLIMLFMTMNISGQQRGFDRDPVVAGSFYPAGESELKKQLEQHFRDAAGMSSFTLKPGEKARALISPHAGYVFSGTVAASATGCIPQDAEYDNIFLIGSSHRLSFPGASVYSTGNYKTPLGTVTVNTAIAENLTENSDVFTYLKSAHTNEHSLEVQLPFLQYHLGKDIRIVPIIIGTQNSKICEDIAGVLKPWFNENNLFVISSDFSHYPSFEDAEKVDMLTVEALISGDPETFLRTLKKNSGMKINGLATSMCGWTSGLVLLHLSRTEPGLEFKHILYRNSGHSRLGDRSGVVGYHSLALIEKEDAADKGKDFSLSREEEVSLLEIARQSIRSFLLKEKQTEIDKSKLSPSLLKPLGAFVTLNIKGQLRGCIGRFMPSEPLYETVRAMALEAAFGDTRFEPLNLDELEKVTIEISVLSPLRQIDNTEEIILGKHGVYIKKGSRSGTFLPQVANNRDWTVSDFLGHISRDKAGLGWTGWKDAEIYIYEAFVFGEE
ncbi:MAG: AmmeMemoRadiSam system protein B [Bacteroidales bacterium]|nr:AmmeMemoRadiSam system protein B [Bacteroidales bacterium]